MYTANKAKLSRAVPISGTLAEDYLRRRGIELPASSDDHLLWLDDARAGESAMVAVATDDNGGPVAFQLTYLQNDQKSPRQPARRTCKLISDWKVRGVLRIGAVGNAERAAVTEGTEDGLSVHIATGLPVCVAWGVGAIRAPQSIRKVIIVPDYDPPRPDGEPHQTTKLVEQAIDAQLLSGDRSEVSLAAIPPGADGEKNDANAILIRDGLAALAAIVNAASPQTLTFAGWAEKIASKPLEDRGDLRRRALDAIKARYGIGAYTAEQFDRMVKLAESRRRSTAPDDEESVSLVPDPVPHPEPVTTAQVIRMITDNIERFVVMDYTDRPIAAYYTLLTYVYERFDICPKLIITAPVKEAGKTRLSSTLGHMACRGLFFANMSPAIMYRVIEQCQPTMVIAEADAWLADNDELRGLINAGHERDEAFVWRMEKDAHDNMTPARFCVFGPQIISGIGKLHPTMMSRSFVIRMKPKRADQKVDLLRSRTKTDLTEVQPYAARWAADYGEQLQTLQPPEMPPHWRDRQQDNAEILLSIASLGGDAMAEKLREALDLHYMRENKTQSPTVATLLLTDIYDCFVELGQTHDAGKLHSADIIAHLNEMEEAQWATFERGNLLGRPKMMKMLKDFGVSTKQVYRNEKNMRGMTFDVIRQAVETYAPAHLAPNQGGAGARVLEPAENQGKPPSTERPNEESVTGVCYAPNPQHSANPSTLAPNNALIEGTGRGQATDDNLDEIL